MTGPHLTTERRRALELLASIPYGTNEELLIQGQGFKRQTSRSHPRRAGNSRARGDDGGREAGRGRPGQDHERGVEGDRRVRRSLYRGTTPRYEPLASRRQPRRVTPGRLWFRAEPVTRRRVAGARRPMVERTQPLANTDGMPRKPEQPKTWTVYSRREGHLARHRRGVKQKGCYRSRRERI
jgi:hypothetical protein